MSSTLSIIYGSRTGNSKSIAEVAERYANHLGLKTRLLDMKTMNPEVIGEINNLLLIVSTHGEGDPPAVALNFYNYLHQKHNSSLAQLNFSVLALGDSSYKDYCKTGKDFAERFKELQANCTYDLVECDVDFEETARQWIIDAVDVFKNRLNGHFKPEKQDFSFDFHSTDDESGTFQVVVKEKRNLCSEDSTKKTLHLALSLGETKKEYKAGDSVAIKCTNSRFFVDRLLKQLQFDGTHTIWKDDTPRFLKQVLLEDYELSLLTPVVLNKYAEFSDKDDIKQLFGGDDKVKSYCANHDLLDLVTEYPGNISPEDFLTVLRKLKPRLYSVASSSVAYPGEVHITLGVMEYDLDDRPHIGVTSSFLQDRIEVGDRISIYIENNDSFRLPENPKAPTIMISNGTGIAAYRAFLQERKALSAKGKNWLFFGERHSEKDFLYKDEILGYVEDGTITKLNTAFSRDQEEKIYVQHKLLENASDIYDWIANKKAVVYICGNKRTMAVGVRQALLDILCKEGNMSKEEAQGYIKTMKAEKRWQEDVY